MNPELYTTPSPKYKFDIYTAINFTRYSVTEVGALCAAGWAWSLQWLAGRNESVRLDWRRSSYSKRGIKLFLTRRGNF